MFAQSQAQLAAGPHPGKLAAEATLVTGRARIFAASLATNRSNSAPGSPVDRYFAGDAYAMLSVSGLVERPERDGLRWFGIDVNFLNVKVNEGGVVSDRHV